MYSSTSDSTSGTRDSATRDSAARDGAARDGEARDGARIPGLSQSEEGLGFEHAIGNSAEAPRLLVFTAAGRTCACELSGVREIIPNRRATPLPGTPSFVVSGLSASGGMVEIPVQTDVMPAAALPPSEIQQTAGPR